MSKFVGFIVGAIEIVVGILLLPSPAGLSLIISGVVTIVSSTAALLLAPKAPAREAQEQQLQLGEQPRSAIFGEAAVAGSLVDGFNYGGKYGTDWEVLVIRVADHACESLTGFFVNDKYVVFSGDGAVAGYSGQLAVYFRGDTTNDALPSVVTTNGAGWTADDVGAGGADVTVAYKADKSDAKNPVWTGGRPHFQWVVKGKRCYDPRLDSTILGGSGTHRWADPSTWEWSDNAIVCRYNWVRGIYANDDVADPAMLLIGRGLSAAEAPPENVAAAANLCDELVAGERRYRVDGTVYANQKFLEVEEMFSAACAGTVVTREGSVEIEPGHAKAPSFAFTDDEILSGSSVTWNNGIPAEDDREWVNTVVANYVEPAQQWQAHDAPVRRDTADVIADRGSREGTITLRLVKRAAQAGAVAEVTRRMGRLWGRGAVQLGPRFCEIEEGDWGTWTSARRFGGVTRTFRVEAYELDEKWQIKLQLREIAAGVFGDPDAIEDQSVAIPQDEPPAIGTPAGWTLTAEMLDGGGGALPALVIEGTVDDDYAQAIRFEYWADDGVTDPEDVTSWSAGGTELNPSGGQPVRVEITSIGPGGTYYAAVSYLVGGEPGDRLILGPVTAGAVAPPPGDIIYDGGDVDGMIP